MDRLPRSTNNTQPPPPLANNSNADMSDMWNDEHFDDCESENRAPTAASAFVMRMNADVAKRQSTAQVRPRLEGQTGFGGS